MNFFELYTPQIDIRESQRSYGRRCQGEGGICENRKL